MLSGSHMFQTSGCLNQIRPECTPHNTPLHTVIWDPTSFEVQQKYVRPCQTKSICPPFLVILCYLYSQTIQVYFLEYPAQFDRFSDLPFTCHLFHPAATSRSLAVTEVLKSMCGWWMVVVFTIRSSDDSDPPDLNVQGAPSMRWKSHVTRHGFWNEKIMEDDGKFVEKSQEYLETPQPWFFDMRLDTFYRPGGLSSASGFRISRTL